ncbi:DEAD/DEAH box helicase [Gillisia sp. M10.2A]|uniref:DEAD/DEAH box helicase n=1 Tax=Gillisia lutea TaxID=2909668 RepID=A0ABS9EDS7_9FLAO|nr:DEAD/DEAH box helicase [Gillisia lutea]MCF4100329.1 DEAD/DEAH box helicase [Gillisia lutea]
MPFKKLNTPLLEAIAAKGFEEPLPFQKKIISKIKSGVNLFGIAPEGSGKTTAMIISVIEKLNSEAYGDAPRALIFVKDKEAALHLKEKFEEFTKRMDLRIYAAYDEQKIDDQKDEIYYGMDIVIATPRRLKKLFSLTGIHISELKLFIVEDAEFLVRNSAFTDLIRIPESIQKCQYLVFSEKLEGKVARLEDSFMAYSQVVTQS